MNYLLDVNVLVAWAWQDHADHLRVLRWLATILRGSAELLFTSAIPQLGFVRVSVQRSKGTLTVAECGETLAGMLAGLGERHRFLPDDQPSTDWPDWCRSAPRTTDAHLLTLAQAHQLTLATLDTGIPGALVIPEIVPEPEVQ